MMGMADSIVESPISETVFVLRNLSSWKTSIVRKKIALMSTHKDINIKRSTDNVRRAFEPERHIQLKGNG